MKYHKNLKIEKLNIQIKGGVKITPFGLVIGLFLILVTFFTIETATAGAELSSLLRKEKELRDENRRLSGDLMQTSSLSSLELKAESLGFTKPTKILYIQEPAPVAKIPQP